MLGNIIISLVYTEDYDWLRSLWIKLIRKGENTSLSSSLTIYQIIIRYSVKIWPTDRFKDILIH